MTKQLRMSVPLSELGRKLDSGGELAAEWHQDADHLRAEFTLSTSGFPVAAELGLRLLPTGRVLTAQPTYLDIAGRRIDIGVVAAHGGPALAPLTRRRTAVLEELPVGAQVRSVQARDGHLELRAIA